MILIAVDEVTRRMSLAVADIQVPDKATPGLFVELGANSPSNIDKSVPLVYVVSAEPPNHKVTAPAVVA